MHGPGPEGACGHQVDAQQAPGSTACPVLCLPVEYLASFTLKQEKQLEYVCAQSWHGERLSCPRVIPSEIQVKQRLWFHRLSCDAGTVNSEHYGLFPIVTNYLLSLTWKIKLVLGFVVEIYKSSVENVRKWVLPGMLGAMQTLLYLHGEPAESAGINPDGGGGCWEPVGCVSLLGPSPRVTCDGSLCSQVAALGNYGFHVA